MSSPSTADSRKYFAHLALHVGVYAAALGCAGLFDHWVWRCALATLFGATLVQIGFAGHDMGHNQIACSRAVARACNLLCWNLLLGVSSSWWQDRHLTHHRHTHVIGQDPDLYPLYAFELDEAARSSGLRRLVVRYQHWWFWPSLLFARLYYQVASLAFIAASRVRGRLLELALLAAHHAVLWGCVLLTVPRHAVAFVAIGYAVTGLYMGLVFSTNHLGMPSAPRGHHGHGWQIAHTRNIRTAALGRYVFGGLDYQIEHHLYPSLSRFRLPAATGNARRWCASAGLPYHEQRFVEALREIHLALRRVALGARR